MAWNVGGNNNQQGGYQQSPQYQQNYQQNYQQGPADSQELDWNDTITVEDGDGTYVLLPPGDYNFTIQKYERTRSKGNEKNPPCNMAIVYFIVHSDQGEPVVKENYLLKNSMIWKLSQLFCSVGMCKPGDALPLSRFPELVGKSGRLKLKHVNGTGEKAANEYNAIDRLYTQG